MKAMILAAGLGTRLKPFTDHHPKALAVVSGKTLLQHNIEYLLSYDVKDIIINTHHFADQIIDLLKLNNNFGANISFSDESSELLETGGGLKKAEWFFDDGQPFILKNVDVLTDLDLNQMSTFHKAQNAVATLAVSDRDTSRYFLFDQNNHLSGWRNTKTGKEIIVHEGTLVQKAFSGLHIISPEIFSLLDQWNVEQKTKFSIVDPYLQITSSHKIIAFDHTGSRFVDVGKPESIHLAEKLFGPN